MTFVIAYGATLATFVTVDLSFRRFVTLSLFQREILHLLASRPDTVAATLFYGAFCAGLTWLVVLPAAQDGSVLAAARDGALIGLMASGTFRLTSKATLRDWT